MKKNKVMRIASVLLVAVLLSTCAISGTFAKYTTTQKAESTARVAKWDIDFNVANTTTKQFTFDLFKTIKDTNGTDNETDVKIGDNENIIAPGTSGSFEIQLKNESEVTAEYTVKFTATNTNNIPLEFSTDGGKTWKTNITELDIKTTRLEMDTESTKITVQWRWAFEKDETQNTPDTTLGTSGTAKITVKAEVTVTQVD